MKLYFTLSMAKVYEKMLVENKVKYYLMSFFFCKNKKDFCCPKENLLVDSGGYSARTSGKIVSVKDYADFLNKNKIKYGFNLDTNNFEETMQNQIYLEAKTKTYIIPIYHHSDFMSKNKKHRDLLQKLIDAKYKYIGVGGMAGVPIANRDYEVAKFLNYVFSKTRNKIKVHGLGITNTKLLERYPFYSVDSTSWLSGVRYGVIFDYKKDKLKSGRLNKKNFIKAYRKTSNELVQNGIECYLELEKFITKLWEKRGVKWQ